MKIVTLGCSPYLLTSFGKLHSWIIQHLHNKCDALAVLAHSHDASYFVPEVHEGHTCFFYKFDDQFIPLFPFQKGKNEEQQSEVVQLYEIIRLLKPDLIITVDDAESTYHMQALKTYLPDQFKWLAVVLNGALPIKKETTSVLEQADAILCTNRFTHDYLNDFANCRTVAWNYVGVDVEKFYNQAKRPNGFNVFCSAKNAFKDCLPLILESSQVVSEAMADFRLNLHTNKDDSGLYDLDFFKEQFDPGGQFLRMTEGYSSLKKGYNEQEMNEKLNESHLFLSASMVSATSMGVFEALAAGCLPILNKQGTDKEIMILLKDFLSKNHYYYYNDMLIESLPFWAAGEKRVRIPLVDSISKMLLSVKTVIEIKKIQKRFSEIISLFSNEFSRDKFLHKVDDLIDETIKNDEKVFTLD